MNKSDFYYDLPQELIAQKPMEPRDASRLMVVHRAQDRIEHRHFYDILEYLSPGDVLVVNHTRVIPARLYGRKVGTGGKIEFLLLKRLSRDEWEVILKPGKKAPVGARFEFGNGELLAEIIGHADEGGRIVRFRRV